MDRHRLLLAVGVQTLDSRHRRRNLNDDNIATRETSGASINFRQDTVLLFSNILGKRPRNIRHKEEGTRSTSLHPKFCFLGTLCPDLGASRTRPRTRSLGPSTDRHRVSRVSLSTETGLYSTYAGLCPPATRLARLGPVVTVSSAEYPIPDTSTNLDPRHRAPGREVKTPLDRGEKSEERGQVKTSAARAVPPDRGFRVGTSECPEVDG